jgi:hypothetical protein
MIAVRSRVSFRLLYRAAESGVIFHSIFRGLYFEMGRVICPSRIAAVRGSFFSRASVLSILVMLSDDGCEIPRGAFGDLIERRGISVFPSFLFQRCRGVGVSWCRGVFEFFSGLVWHFGVVPTCTAVRMSPRV